MALDDHDGDNVGSPEILLTALIEAWLGINFQRIGGNIGDPVNRDFEIPLKL